ncbi:hypothetical protein [Streptomyces sioyaensis]|uniref:hypothetical protein n=1 Tax=Streptomyces sioyaensis TaxID=67364 RepID=UPI0037ACAD51
MTMAHFPLRQGVQPILEGREFDVDELELVKARTGLRAVIASDVAIIIAVIVGITVGPKGGELTPLLTSAFTAITAITTAYFGIKAVTNTADAVIRRRAASNDSTNPDESVTEVNPVTATEPPEAGP